VERRHSLRNLLHGLGWRAVLGVALGDFSGGVWRDMATELGTLAYGRDLEREADLEGLKLLRRAGIPADGMETFYARLAQGGKSPVPLLSTHPVGTERLAALRDAKRKQGRYTSQPLSVDWAELRQVLVEGAVN
jgi:predicted Zn-dependent protease